ncbi:MAG TPA: hypothetical protein VEG38_05865 [Acidimicrobiia bacterium]|nr:hypothetical protein [Acidimicrobiia bacterium]
MTSTHFLRLGTAVLIACLVVTVRPPAADAELLYTASVSAWGVRINETIPGGPAAADTLFDGGGPTASANATSSGSSSSFGSFPYPGPVVVSLPSLLAGSIPQVRLPDYPFYVEASHPTNPRPDPKAAPGGTLSATAGPSEAFGYAGIGVGDDATALGHFEASAAVTRTADSAVATGASVGRSIKIGPVEIAALTSTATATLVGDGTLKRDSTLTVTGMTVDGQGLAVADGAIVLADTKVPLSEAGAVAKTLADAGIEVAYLAATETATGLTSSALAISRRQETPGGLQLTVNLILGQVVASIDGSAVDSSPVSIGNDVPSPEAQQPAGETAAESAARPELSTALSADVSTPLPDLPPTAYPPLAYPLESAAGPSSSSSLAPSGETAGETAPVTAAAPASERAAAATLATVRRKPWSFDTRSAYLLMAAAVAAAMAIQLVLGRRKSRWNS